MAVLAVDSNFDLDIPTLDGRSLDQMLRSLLTELRHLSDEKMSDFAGILERAEGEKLNRIKKHLDEFIAHLEKAKKAEKLGGILKALGFLGLILAAIMTVLTPSPMSIALLVVAIAMAFEPLLAEAAGSESLIQKTMSGLAKALSEALGEVGGMIATMLIVMAAMVVMSVGAGAGISALSNAVAGGASRMAAATQTVTSAFRNLFSDLALTERQVLALRKFMGAIEGSVLLAMSGVQTGQGVARFQAAELFKEVAVEKAAIDWWTAMLDLLDADIATQREFWTEVDLMWGQLYLNR